MICSKFRMLGCLLCLAAAGLSPVGVKAAILFDSDGAPGGAIAIDKFDWDVGNGFALGGSTSIVNWVASGGATKTPFEFFFQAKLSSTSLAGTQNTPANLLPAGLNELTVVGAITEVVTFASGVGTGSFAAFDLAPVQTANYFEIWFDPNKDANDLTGTGFNGYAGVPVAGAAGSGTNVGLGADSNAVLILSGTVGNVVISNFSTNAPTVADPIGNLDQSSNGDNYGPGVAGPGSVGIDSVSGGGITTMTVNIVGLTVNPAFFPSSTISSINFTTQVATPYTGIDPSARFLVGTTTTSAAMVPTISGAGDIAGMSLGSINGGGPLGGGGPDFQAFVDGSSTLNGANFVTPEPSSITMFGLLFAFGAARLYRRRRSA